MSDDSWIRAFSTQIDELRDFPELAKINNVVHIAKTQDRLARSFVECIINRLISTSTPPSYRKPLFYAIDAIMKNAAEAFGPHFAQQLGEKFPMTIRDISDVDRGKLTFMMGTWDERRYFAPELIIKMKNRLQAPAAPAVSASRAPTYNQQPAPIYIQAPVMQPVAQVPVINPLAQVLLNTALTGGAAGSNLNDIISLEMNNILQQMYHDMNIPNPLSLDEIAIANPTLYAQLRSQAESNIQSLIGGNVVQPAGNQPVATIPSSNSHHSRKRPGDFQSNQGNRPASNYNNNRQLGRQGANNSNLPSRGGSGLPPAPPKLTIPPVSSGIPAAKLPSVANVAPLVQAPKNGVKGFVSEAAVVIDVDRVQLITENLTNYKHNSSSIPFPDSDKLVELSNSLLQRLQGYLATIKVPPTLPSILNGPLPNEPIFAKTNFKAVSTGPVVAAGPVKRAMPVFNMDLSRNPNTMIRALYEDRPHQYHEDGLRFRTLVQLSQHTDKSLEKKKLLAKTGKQREHRELFCTIDQWVSDFNALNMKNKPTEETKSSSSGEALESFAVPADENFVRCPFSQESFDKFFDNVEGCFMYRNAVKVLVSEKSNSSIYQKGKAAVDPDTEEKLEGLRYLIVYKPLIVDQWIQEGKAITLEEAIQRYESLGDTNLTDLLKQAAGEEDVENMFFVL